MAQLSDNQLLAKAIEAMKNAYCAYSKFQVGAALLTSDGSLFLGSNHENAAYGSTICAERSAMCAALSAGYRKFEAIAVVHAPEHPASPCGACRQFLVEFGEFRVVLGSSTSSNVSKTTTFELLPHAFNTTMLHENEKRLQAHDAFHGACQ